MTQLRFEWDPKKASSNEKKHRVAFTEAKTVFLDPDALVISDPDHSQDEDRFIILGLSDKDRALVVVHCFRVGGDVIRIISARRAGTKEQKPYWEKKS
ncbi:MAG: BrnT family toxin [Opitutales bacterium]|nr:BrnT family toxin [Opitutales bacterium]